MVFASCSMVVDDMTEHEHAAGQKAEDAFRTLLSAQAISDAALKKLSSSYSTFLSPGLGFVSLKASSFGSSIIASSGSTATGLSSGLGAG